MSSTTKRRLIRWKAHNSGRQESDEENKAIALLTVRVCGLAIISLAILISIGVIENIERDAREARELALLLGVIGGLVIISIYLAIKPIARFLAKQDWR
jgi:hypothetical protein